VQHPPIPTNPNAILQECTSPAELSPTKPIIEPTTAPKIADI